MKKLLLLCLVGLLGLAGCSKDEENGPVHTVMYKGEVLPITVASYSDYWNTDPDNYREIEFHISNLTYKLVIRARYAEADRFGTGTFQHHSGYETPDYHYFKGALYNDENMDGIINGDNDFHLRIEDGTVELSTFNPEGNQIKATFNLLLEDGNSITGTFAGHYSEGNL